MAIHQPVWFWIASVAACATAFVGHELARRRQR